MPERRFGLPGEQSLAVNFGPACMTAISEDKGRLPVNRTNLPVRIPTTLAAARNVE